MAYVVRIRTIPNCVDCSGITDLCLDDRTWLTREQAYFQVMRGAAIHSGSDNGPILQAVERGNIRYVRTEPNDSPNDNLLRLPRG